VTGVQTCALPIWNKKQAVWTFGPSKLLLKNCHSI